MVVSPFPSILNWLFGVPSYCYHARARCFLHVSSCAPFKVGDFNNEWDVSTIKNTQRLEVKQDTRWNWSGINFTSSSVDLQEVLQKLSKHDQQDLLVITSWPSLTQVQQSGGLFAFASNLNHQGPETFRQLDEVMREGWCCLMHR